MQRPHSDYTRSWYKVIRTIEANMNNNEGKQLLNKHFNSCRDDIINHLGNLSSVYKSADAVRKFKTFIQDQPEFKECSVVNALDEHLKLFS